MEVVRKILIENQGLLVSIMIFILSFFVIFLWISFRKTAYKGSWPGAKRESDSLKKYLEGELRKMRDLFKKVHDFGPQIQKIEKTLQEQIEARKREKPWSDKEVLEERQKTKKLFDELNKRLKDFRYEIDGTNTQVSVLQNNAEDIKEEINNLEGKSVSLSLKNSESMLFPMEQRIDKLQEEVKEYHKQMENLYRVFESIDADMVEITGKLKYLEEQKKG